VLVATACGGAETTERDAVAGAAATTKAAATWRFAFAMTSTGSGEGDRFTEEGHGVYDHARRRARIFRGEEETIVIEGVMYVRHDADEPRWIKHDGEFAMEPFALVDDPRTALDLVSETSRTIERRGDESIRGVATTRFHAELDFGRFLDKQFPSEETEPQSADLSTMPLDIWVDDEGRVRRLAYELQTDSEEEGSFKGWVEFFDFGVAVDIEPPPESLVDEVEFERDCGDANGTPISSDRVVNVLGDHGFGVKVTERRECATTVSSIDWMRADEAAAAAVLREEGWIMCAVAGFGNGTAIAMLFSSGTPRPREVKLDAENASCTLYVEPGQKGDEQEARFRAAMAELRR